MNVRQLIEQEVATWEQLSHPALLQRFILRNGKPFTPAKRIGRKRKAKECFCNATEFVVRNGGTYVEGLVMNRKIPWLIHHAWVTMGGDDAMDPTLNAENYEYFGVTFQRGVLTAELVSNKVYGLLDPGLGMNTRLMFALDPELKTICDTIMARRRQKETA